MRIRKKEKNDRMKTILINNNKMTQNLSVEIIISKSHQLLLPRSILTN